MSIYSPGVCCSLDPGSESIVSASAHIESIKKFDESDYSNEYLIANIQSEIIAGKTTPNGNLPKEISRSELAKVLVTGQINTDTGFHSGNDTIKIYSPSLDEKYVTKSNSTGYFQLDKVSVADDYQLQILPYKTYQRYYEQISIASPFSQFHIQLNTPPVSRLQGQVLSTGDVPVTNFTLRVRSREISRWERFITTDSIGHFELDNVPVGQLIFNSIHEGQVLVIEGYYLQSNQNQYLNLIVDEGSSVISGIVIDQDGELVVGAIILLNWENLDGNKRTTAYRRTNTKQDGSFFFRGIGAGRHNLIAVDISSGAAYKQALNLSYDFEEILIYLK